MNVCKHGFFKNGGRAQLFGSTTSALFLGGLFGVVAAISGTTSVAVAEDAKVSAFHHVSSSSQNLKVKITVPSHGCHLGDWDAIATERDNSDNPKILLSLEPLASDSAIKPEVKDISAFDLKKGYTAIFNAPKVNAPTPFALYICKDSDNVGKCSGKPKMDIQKVLEIYMPTVPKDNQLTHIPEFPDPPKASDKIYYFGFVVMGKTNIYSLKQEAIEKNQAAIGKELAQIGVPEAEKVFQEVRLLDATLKSAHPSLEDGALNISLPHLDVAACVPRSKPSNN